MVPTHQTESERYFDDFSRSNWSTWGLSGLAALAMNLTLFLLMPCLMDAGPDRLTAETVIPQVTVVRVEPKASQLRREPEKPPIPPRPKPPVRTGETAAKPPAPRMTLPFEIDPRLPDGPGSLALPPLQSAPAVASDSIPAEFSESQLDAPLIAVVRIPAVYPPGAIRNSIEGWVKVRFVVNETGRTEGIQILDARPPGLFESSVRRSVGTWRFKPGTVGGMPVRTVVQTTVRFELE
jgi:protein TonB